jgi:hypothetical protein
MPVEKRMTTARLTPRSLSAILAVLVVSLLSPWAFAAPQALGASASNAQERPFVVEYYYKVKWGHAEEFITLFKKNHYPVLKKEVEMGRLLKVTAVTPRYHTTEDGRWDYRVTIIFKNAAAANEDFDEKSLIKQLYPDQQTYQREEQRRFEILDAHWDLPVKDLDLNAP